MMIVEQNEEYFVNYDNVICIATAVRENKENEKVYAVIATTTIKDERIILGEYKIKERAKEVLRGIICTYKQWNKDANNAVTIIPKVYEMPKE